jgi:hypothetical protein
VIYPSWTPEEEEIIRAVYPHYGGVGVAKVLKNRTHNAIMQRASLYVVTRMLPEKQRSTESVEAIAARVRAKFAKEGIPAPQPDTAAALREKKNMRFGPGGVAYEHGTTAATKPGLKTVPDSEIGLLFGIYFQVPYIPKSFRGPR